METFYCTLGRIYETDSCIWVSFSQSVQLGTFDIKVYMYSYVPIVHSAGYPLKLHFQIPTTNFPCSNLRDLLLFHTQN